MTVPNCFVLFILFCLLFFLNKSLPLINNRKITIETDKGFEPNTNNGTDKITNINEVEKDHTSGMSQIS